MPSPSSVRRRLEGERERVEVARLEHRVRGGEGHLISIVIIIIIIITNTIIMFIISIIISMSVIIVLLLLSGVVAVVVAAANYQHYEYYSILRLKHRVRRGEGHLRSPSGYRRVCVCMRVLLALLSLSLSLLSLLCSFVVVVVVVAAAAAVVVVVVVVVVAAVVCEQTILSREPLPCYPSAETALQPLTRSFESLNKVRIWRFGCSARDDSCSTRVSLPETKGSPLISTQDPQFMKFCYGCGLFSHCTTMRVPANT